MYRTRAAVILTMMSFGWGGSPSSPTVTESSSGPLEFRAAREYVR